SVAFINQWLHSKQKADNGGKNRKKVVALEALSATGLRALRYAHECPGIDEVVANDIDSKAAETIAKNVKMNGMEGKVRVTNQDAWFVLVILAYFKVELILFQSHVMYDSEKAQGERYTIIDLV
ncbi:hypothetical protein HDU96_006736, partial [Phlyctochytrium bullatum]